MTADQLWALHAALKDVSGKTEQDRATIKRVAGELYEHWRDAIRDETEREIRLDSDELAEEPEKA